MARVLKWLILKVKFPTCAERIYLIAFDVRTWEKKWWALGIAKTYNANLENLLFDPEI